VRAFLYLAEISEVACQLWKCQEWSQSCTTDGVAAS
jgi:hypothetical protein